MRVARQVWRGAWAIALELALGAALGTAQTTPGVAPVLPVALQGARQALRDGHFAEAEGQFLAWLKAHPANDPSRPSVELGLGDALLGQDRLEPAEAAYRRATASAPRLWQAHRNLVLVEARLDRWESFDDERTLLRGARQRGEPGLDPRESDLIDRFTVDGRPWLVREYFQPVGRSEARYNFTAFNPDGKVLAYLSLEPAAAAAAGTRLGDVRIGTPGPLVARGGPYTLNWYTGAAHGEALRYAKGEPSYETLRADVIRWLKQPANAARLRSH